MLREFDKVWVWEELVTLCSVMIQGESVILFFFQFMTEIRIWG